MMKFYKCSILLLFSLFTEYKSMAILIKVIFLSFKLNNKIFRILQNAPLKSHTLSLYINYNTLPIPLLHDFQILLSVHKFLYHSNKMPSTFASYFIQSSLVCHAYVSTRQYYNTHKKWNR